MPPVAIAIATIFHIGLWMSMIFRCGASIFYQTSSPLLTWKSPRPPSLLSVCWSVGWLVGVSWFTVTFEWSVSICPGGSLRRGFGAIFCTHLPRTPRKCHPESRKWQATPAVRNRLFVQTHKWTAIQLQNGQQLKLYLQLQIGSGCMFIKQ